MIDPRILRDDPDRVRAAQAKRGLSDSRAPIDANAPDDGDDAMLLSWFARDLAVPYGKTLHIPPQDLRELDPNEMLDHVLTTARDQEILPKNADRATLERYFEVYLANGMALQGYRPGQCDLAVTLFKARNETQDFGPLLGWDELCTRSILLHEVGGDHNSMMYEPQVQSLAEQLHRTLPPARNATGSAAVAGETAGA